MNVCTMGFKTLCAEEFFGRLKKAAVRRIVDVRHSNRRQLCGFTKKQDLPYFMRELLGGTYVHLPELAPTQEIRNLYDKDKPQKDWDKYEKFFLKLMASRRVEHTIPRDLLDGACLLCSEETADHCHRRLVTEYLREKWGNIEILHL